MRRSELRDWLLQRQGGVCSICRLTPEQARERDIARGYRVQSAGTFVLDHDHATGMTRGVLCVPCNSGLGSFQDDVFRLEHAREYVANWAESDIVPFTMEYTDLEVK